jgi:minor extracellular serine protease Vpr
MAERLTVNRILPDPNPIDVEGHGTHVADIIGGLGYAAGVNADGAVPGQGRRRRARKSPSTASKSALPLSTACNGLALLKAMDNAADLDGNPTTIDPADVINMSLGSSYGQPEDDLTFFTNQAAAFGIIVVASAGNSANKPYIVGSPSIADGAISVAQTTVPSATRYPLFYASSAVTGTIEQCRLAELVDGCLPLCSCRGRLLTATPMAATGMAVMAYTDNMAGRVVLADRGSCNFTLKAKNAADAGAIISLIGLIAPGDPFEGGDGGDRPIPIPSFMIDQATSNLLKAQIANGVVAGIDPADAINLAYTMVGSSSRGPRNHDGVIKPDIGAPGASVSAIATGGAASGPFGGTSGAAPMVSGVAALLRGVYGDSLLPQQYKALLMNTGDPVYNDVPRDDLAPATRSGGGQVNARAAYYSKLIAWDSTDMTDPLSWTGSMSFGYVPASEHQTYTRTLTIQNLGPLGQGVALTSWFRSGEDAGQGVFVTPAVSDAFVPAGGSIEVPIVLDIFPAGSDVYGTAPVHPWFVDRGGLGADGLVLQFQEYDGFVAIESQSNDPIHVVWQVLPKAAADIAVNVTSLTAGTGALVNAAPEVEGFTDIFGLVEVDANDYGYVIGDCESIGLPQGCNLSPVDLYEVGVRAYTDTVPFDFLEFAVTIWDYPYRAGQYPPEFDIYIDSNADGTDDYVIFNGDLTLNASDGRNVVFLVDLSAPLLVAEPWYFIDSTFNSNNFILPMDAASIGVTPGQPFRFSVFAYDAYFTNDLWDCAPKVGNVCTGAYQYTPGAARFQVPEAQIFPTVPAAGSEAFSWTTSAAARVASPDQIGLLFMHRNAFVGRESDHVVFADTYLPIIKK